MDEKLTNASVLYMYMYSMLEDFRYRNKLCLLWKNWNFLLHCPKKTNESFFQIRI